MVWKETTKVGFGIKTVGNKRYVVANYSPAGNIEGKVLQNVELWCVDQAVSHWDEDDSYLKYVDNMYEYHKNM